MRPLTYNAVVDDGRTGQGGAPLEDQFTVGFLYNNIYIYVVIIIVICMMNSQSVSCIQLYIKELFLIIRSCQREAGSSVHGIITNRIF